jgi:ribosomal protein S18 acetylase RimI-like enzyme
MKLITLTAGDHQRVTTIAHVLAAAFGHDPVTRWLVTDPARYPDVMVRFFTALATDALSGGAVDVITDDTDQPLAAALWFDQTAADPLPRTAPTDPDPRWETVFGTDAPRWYLLDRLMSGSHPAIPHWYLMVLGVRPDLQRHGLGSHLLEHARENRGDVDAYLEASTTRSRALYARHGYDCLGRLHAPEGPPPLWPMLLPAERPHAAQG